MLNSKALWIAAIVLAFAAGASAGKHPVPLAPNTDTAKCLECHENKGKGAAVHTAIATGCASCHEVRVSKDVTRTKLTKPTTHSLCLSCHEDKKQSAGTSQVHAPAVRDCVKCHEPHTAANANQLLKPTAGDKGENLCLSCHDTGENVPEKGSRHAALDMGCQTCHVTHKTGQAGVREFDFHLTKNTPALCADCHDAKDEALGKAHQGQPFATADCVSCHNPHSSSGPKLAQNFVHQPFGDRMCDTCHAAPKDGKVVLTQDDPKALCVTCHEEQAKHIDTAKVQHAGAQGSCTDCHNAHAGKTPGFVQPNPVTACTSCHSDQAEQHKQLVRHKPAFETGCATCHEPHGGENNKLLRAKTTNGVCLECHGPDARPAPVEGAKLVAIFGGKVRLPQNYFAGVTRLPLKYGLGHPVERHPVQDQMEPSDITKVRVALNCGSCHQPHAGNKPGMLVNDQENNMAFCASCHKNFGER